MKAALAGTYPPDPAVRRGVADQITAPAFSVNNSLAFVFSLIVYVFEMLNAIVMFIIEQELIKVPFHSF